MSPRPGRTSTLRHPATQQTCLAIMRQAAYDLLMLIYCGLRAYRGSLRWTGHYSSARGRQTGRGVGEDAKLHARKGRHAVAGFLFAPGNDSCQRLQRRLLMRGCRASDGEPPLEYGVDANAMRYEEGVRDNLDFDRNMRARDAEQNLDDGYTLQVFAPWSGQCICGLWRIGHLDKILVNTVGLLRHSIRSRRLYQLPCGVPVPVLKSSCLHQRTHITPSAGCRW